MNGRLKILTSLHFQVQKNRIRFNNASKALEREGLGDERVREIYEAIIDDLLRAEREIQEEMMIELNEEEIYTEWLKKVKGVGPVMAAWLVGWLDPEKADTVSAFWKYCGLHVEDGQAPRPRKGQKINWNPKLKAKLMGVLAPSFLRSKSPYADFYYQYKERKLNLGWKEGHAHFAALRYMVKQFLKDLWVTWREMLGLPVRPPYHVEKLGLHDHAPKVA